MCSHTKMAKESCDCERQLARLLEPRILLTIATKPAHGYYILEMLSETLGLNSTEPGMLYRTLRRMEKMEFVKSSWETKSSGPAKRVYEITDLGWERLEIWSATLKNRIKVLNGFVNDYELLRKKVNNGLL